MLATKFLSSVLLLGLGTVIGVSAQSAPVASKDVRINVQLTSPEGQPVRGLTQEDFAVLDNHRDAQLLAAKEQTPATEAAHAIILLDAVNVRHTELAYERDQVLKFLRANGGKLSVPTSVAVLSNTGIQMQKGFSRDGNELAAGLDDHSIGLRTITRAAGFWGADERMETSVNGLLKLSQFAATLPGRKFVLWVSPGWPLLSGPEVVLSNKEEKDLFRSIAEISNQLRAANITLYSLNALGAVEDIGRANYYKSFTKGVAKPGDAQLGNLGLQVLAVQSGGLALQGSTDLSAMLTRCFQDSTGWYELRFATPEAGAYTPYHRIDLKLDKPAGDVRTRDGYYIGQ